MAQRSRKSAPPSSPTAARRSPAQLTALREKLAELVEPVLTKAGYELEELAVKQVGRRYLLRITVDGDRGVNLDTIADLSRAVADALDAAEEAGEEIVPGEYQLEVSSPGVDRPLTQPRHWRRATGRLVAVTVHPEGAPAAAGAQPATATGTPGKKAGAKQVTGRVVAVDETTVTLEIAEKKSARKSVPSTQTFALAELGPGRVQIEFNRLDEILDEDLEEIADEESADGESADRLGEAGGDEEEEDEEDVEEQ
jgi:ribosome maturation factor RimP